MKMVKSCLLLVSLTMASLAIHAQTVDEIVNKYLDATGGKDKIAQMKSIRTENTIEVMGNSGPSTVTILNNRGFRVDSEISGKKIVQVVTDKGGWAINPMMGSTTPTEIPEDAYKQTKGQIDLGGPLLNYAAKGNKVELDGKEGGAYKLKVTTADSVETTYFIDTANYRLDKVTQSATVMGQPMEVSSTFSDYKKTDYGIIVPYTVEISYGGQFNLTTHVNKVEINPDVDPKIFEMPKS